MRNNCIRISGENLSQEQIWNSIIRHKLNTPNFTMLTSTFMKHEITNPSIRKLVVVKPNKFVGYGFFLPVKKMPMLRVFRKETFDFQLKQQVMIVNQG